MSDENGVKAMGQVIQIDEARFATILVRWFGERLKRR